ncbi:MAG: hypothetical protein MH252_21220, partial [Thermosynechococcaceae cyanobacterium MS004]|nr:hypothetical protein [Thermosynechococcaceae cyanobacterium MS004]
PGVGMILRFTPLFFDAQSDLIHPGRRWAEKLKGVKGENDLNVILKNIQDYVEALKVRGSDV